MKTKAQWWINEHWMRLFTIAAVLLTVYVAARVHLRFWSIDTVGYDTYYSWVEGRRILRGQNPYERILHGGMDENNKYATYFPLFYEASALAQHMGLRQYHEWIGFWRYIFLVSNLAVGLVLAARLYLRNWALALLGMAFWYFNRWSLNTSESAALDFIPILLVVLSLVLFSRYRRTSLLLFSFSLAIKQIAIFLVPLYLIWEYHRSRSVWGTIVAGIWIASIPLLASLPFLVWNPEGFLKSIAFSGTRSALNHFAAASIDDILNLEGLVARIPLLIMLCAAYLAAWYKAMGRFGSAMIVMAIFIAFNSVLFEHYPVWLMALLPLSVADWGEHAGELKRAGKV
jgi:hypothetical protein